MYNQKFIIFDIFGPTTLYIWHFEIVVSFLNDDLLSEELLPSAILYLTKQPINFIGHNTATPEFFQDIILFRICYPIKVLPKDPMPVW
jgi:hypothetical protein